MADRQHFGKVGWMAGLRAWIGMSANEIGLNPIKLPVLLSFLQSPKGHRIDPHPRTVLANPGRTNGLAIFSRESWVCLDCNQHALHGHKTSRLKVSQSSFIEVFEGTIWQLEQGPLVKLERTWRVYSQVEFRSRLVDGQNKKPFSMVYRAGLPVHFFSSAEADCQMPGSIRRTTPTYIRQRPPFEHCRQRWTGINCFSALAATASATQCR